MDDKKGLHYVKLAISSLFYGTPTTRQGFWQDKNNFLS